MSLIDAIDPGPRRRVALVVALLAVALACVAALAYEAYRAHSSHRTATERAVNETVEFAAWSYAGAARRVLGDHLFGHGLERMEAIGMEEGPERLGELLDGPDPLHFGEIRYGFRRDLRSGETRVVGDVSDPARRFVEDSLKVARYDSRWHLGAAVLDGDTSVLAWRLHPKTGARPTVAYGFGVPWSVVERMLEEAYAQVALLPPGLVRGRAESDLFGVEVGTSLDAVLFRAGERPDSAGEVVWAVDTLGGAFGGLEVELSASAPALEPLSATARPGSGWLLYGGLFALVAGLALAALLLMRREHRLARAHADFVSGVTHAFRTPLAQIRLYGETLALERERAPDERKRALDVILREAGRLDRMVDDVLAFVRSGGAERPSERRNTDLHALAVETVESFRAVAEPRGTRLRVEGSGGLSADVDQTAIRKALSNLLDNAVKYGPPEQTVSVGVDRSSGRIRITVEDEGPGVPAESRVRIWRPFERLDDHASIGGTGIGLAVVQRIAADHGGSTHVEDGRDGGARFVLTLPVSRPGDADGPARDREASRGEAPIEQVVP